MYNIVQTFAETAQDGLVAIKGYPVRFAKKTPIEKAFSVAKLALFGACLTLNSLPSMQSQPFLPEAVGLAKVFGASALGLLFLKPHLKTNKHMNAIQVPIAGLLSAQKLVLGAYGYAIMAGIASARTLTMAILPDEDKDQKMRYKVAMGFSVLSIVGVGLTGVMGSAWNFLPLASSLLGTMASSLTSSRTDRARGLYLVGCLNNAVYSSMYSGSAAATILDLTGALNQGSAIRNNDLKSKRSVFQYISSLIKRDNTKNVP